MAGVLQQNPDVDGILTLGPTGATPTLEALDEAGMLGDVKFATFDLSPEVLQAITDGDMLFAIDQAQYLQGYLPIVFLTKYLETGALPLGSVDRVVLTGPQIVTADTAQDVVQVLGGRAAVDAGTGVGAHAVSADPSIRITAASGRPRRCRGDGMATTATEPTADTDERVRRVGGLSRLLGRPELGAIAGLSWSCGSSSRSSPRTTTSSGWRRPPRSSTGRRPSGSSRWPSPC